MRCGLALFQTRLSPLQQVAKRNFVRSAAMSEDPNRWEKQYWGKEGGLQPGEVRSMPPVQPVAVPPLRPPASPSPPPPAGFWNAG